MTLCESTDLAERVERLADRLAEDRDLTDRRWREALHAVPRHVFVPEVAWASPNGDGEDYPVDRSADEATWWDAVYSDTILITQLDDGAGDLTTGEGRPTSSNSAPGAVLTYLEELRVRDHDRVLDIGTGTGWTAALLGHRVGDRNVTTVEVDPDVAAGAEKNLDAAGHRPNLVVGDGTLGCPEGALFDRVHATCSVARVPYAWIRQTRPGGVLVVPYNPGYGYGYLARLVVDDRGVAVGRFPSLVGFMMARSQRHATGPPLAFVHHADHADRSTTALDPRTVAFDSYAADLAIAALAPGCQERMGAADDDSGEYTFWLFETGTQVGSWAKVEYAPGQAGFAVDQYGPRRLWDEVADAYLWWVRAGRPGLERFGLTVTPDGQQVWLDDPGRVIARS